MQALCLLRLLVPIFASAPFATLRSKKVARKLSQRFRDAKTGGMIVHGNLKRM